MRSKRKGCWKASAAADREGDAVGDFRIGAARAGTDPEGLVIGLDDPVRGKKSGGRGQAIVVGRAGRQNPLVAHLLQGRIHPVEDGIPVLRLQNLAGVGRAVPMGCDMGTGTSGDRRRGCGERRAREEPPSRPILGTVVIFALRDADLGGSQTDQSGHALLLFKLEHIAGIQRRHRRLRTARTTTRRNAPGRVPSTDAHPQ